MAKGYATVAEVITDLGGVFTAAQAAQMVAWLEDAEAFIDAYTGRAWLTGAITAETYRPDGPQLYLRQRPIASVEAVVGHRYDSTVTTLASGTDYVVQDATRGLLYGGWWCAYDWLTVSYTPAATVPRGINRVTRLLVAEGLQSAVGGGGNIKSFSAFGQVSVVFRDDALSPQVRALLDPWRAPLVLA